jgi:2-keto-4-pentenoate hydratase/2-oxohepta-3-ene-1,7-dioic acid hydratase in catechol pathway
MRLATFSDQSSPRVGIVTNDGIVDIPYHVPGAPIDMVGVMMRWSELRSTLEILDTRPPDFTMSSVVLYAPVPTPRKILAIGLNYADHCAEAGLDLPKHQIWFSKAVTSVSGPFDNIELPPVTTQLDHECELVAVIGRRCRNVTRAEARNVIFGYCVGNDVSVRDWQLRTSQWVLGKSFDTHAPVGPWITTGDDVDPHSLDIRCLVNGEVRQNSNTRYMVFDCYAQIEELSKVMTLEPGDLIFTGTCGGVGMGRRPPLWLNAGDIVRVEIEKLGAIENRVEHGSSATRVD